MSTQVESRSAASTIIDVVVGAFICLALNGLSTLLLMKTMGVGPGVVLFVGLYQLPYAIPLAVWLRRRRSKALANSYLLIAVAAFVLSGALALLIWLGLIAA
jgi:hypothetical protein